MELNKASLDQWFELLKEEKYELISNRILLLDSQDHEMLNEEEQKELKTLIKLEKKFLKEAEFKVNNHNKIIKKLSFYRNHLGTDERLLKIFLNRINNRLLDDDIPQVEMVTEEYIKMMEEDMDIKGHEKLNKLYEDLLLNDSLIDEDELLRCDNPKCVYCRKHTEEEENIAYAHLSDGGYLEHVSEGALVDLMIIINRLETELAEFTTIDCDLGFEELDDIDMDDLEDDEEEA